MGKVFVYDHDKCNGCRNCQLACKDEHVDNEWAPWAKPQPDTGQFWTRVEERVRGQVPKVRVSYTVRMCQPVSYTHLKSPSWLHSSTAAFSASRTSCGKGWLA